MTPTNKGIPTRNSQTRRFACRLPRIAGLARSLTAATGIAMAATLVATPTAAMASDVSTLAAPQPTRIDLLFDTDLLGYDLCWSSDVDAARIAVAMAIAEEMSDPAGVYTIRLSQLPRNWKPLRVSSTTTAAPSGRSRRGQAALTTASSSLHGLTGAPIDRDTVRWNKNNYLEDLDEALAEVIDYVRVMRPGAVLTIEGFETYSRAGSPVLPEYPLVGERLSFVEIDLVVRSSSTSSTTSSRLTRRGRRAMTQSAPQDTSGETANYVSPALEGDAWLLYRTSSGWLFADENALPSTLGTDDADVLEQWRRPPVEAITFAVDFVPPGEEPGPTDPPPDDDGGDSDGGDTDGGDTGGGDTGGGDTGGGDSDGGDTGGGDTGGGDTGGGDTGGGDSDGGDTGGGDTGGGDTDGGDTGGGDTGGGGGGGGGGDSLPDIPVLEAGSGFVGPTSATPVGSSTDPNYLEAVDASWTLAPTTPPTTQFEIGVGATHTNGIDRVEFSLNGGPWSVSASPATDATTGDPQWRAAVDPSGLTEPYEVRAVAFPSTAGQPVVLAPLMIGETPDGGDTDPPAPGEIPLLVPGGGFGGATPTPSNVGNSSMPGYTAQSIARWDVVPYQTFSGVFQVGVVAFHMNDIDRVDFSVDGGPWQSVYEVVYNPRTKVYEYTVAVDAADFGDGLIEIRAIAYPKDAGEPRLLAGPIDWNTLATRSRGEYSLFLYANEGGSLAQTVNVVGGGSVTPDIQDAHVVYLPEGDHNFSSIKPPNNNGNRFYTVSGAPGTDPAKVRLTTGGARYTGNIRLRNLTLRTDVWGSGMGWIDNVIYEAGGPLVDGQWFNGWLRDEGVFATDVVYQNIARGSLRDLLLRNVTFQNLGADAIREFEGMAVNVVVRDLLDLDGTHNDVAQWFTNPGYDPIENVIFYNMEATDNVGGQSFFVSTNNPIHRDWAIVNFSAAAKGGGGASFGDPYDHLLIINFTWVRPLNNPYNFVSIGMSQPRSSYENLLVKDSFFYRWQVDEDFLDDTNWSQNNHFMRFVARRAGGGAFDVSGNANGIVAELGVANGNTIGGRDNFSFYETAFVNAAAGDWRPLANSVLTDRPITAPAFVDVDVRNKVREGSTIGAFNLPN